MINDPEPQTSKLSAASVFIFIPALPLAWIAWEARWSDEEWLWSAGAITAAMLVLSSMTLGLIGAMSIVSSKGRLKGLGYAIKSMLIGLAAIGPCMALAILT